MYIQLTIQSLHNIYNFCITSACTLSEYKLLTWNYMSNTANIYLTVWDKQTTPKALEWRFLTSTANNNKEFFFYNKIKKIENKNSILL